MAEPVAPSPNNYFVGKGVVVAKRDGEVIWRAVGNVPEFEFTPSTDTLDHFTSQEGVKSKDKTIVLTKGGELRMVMEEATADNLSFIVLGSIDRSGPTPVIQIFGVNSIGTSVRFFATNEVGPKWDAEFLGVDFLPSGSYSPISDEWGQMEVTGQVRSVGGSFGTLKYRPSTPAAPLNAANPVIAANTTLNVGSVATVISNGVWLNTPTSYTYAWYRDGVVIAAATASTYTFVSGDIGKMITAKVVAVNATGSSTASESNAIGPILA
jgi:Fe-S cluster assembly scaffold protein SufB